MLNERQEFIGDDWLDERQPDRQRQVLETPELATTLVQRYCCAGCWGHLNTYHEPGSRLVRVVCDKCGDGRGFVTKRYAEKRRSESFGEAFEVRDLLEHTGLIMRPTRTVAEVLKDLGFTGG